MGLSATFILLCTIACVLVGATANDFTNLLRDTGNLYIKEDYPFLKYRDFRPEDPSDTQSEKNSSIKEEPLSPPSEPKNDWKKAQSPPEDTGSNDNVLQHINEYLEKLNSKVNKLFEAIPDKSLLEKLRALSSGSKENNPPLGKREENTPPSPPSTPSPPSPPTPPSSSYHPPPSYPQPPLPQGGPTQQNYNLPPNSDGSEPQNLVPYLVYAQPLTGLQLSGLKPPFSGLDQRSLPPYGYSPKNPIQNPVPPRRYGNPSSGDLQNNPFPTSGYFNGKSYPNSPNQNLVSSLGSLGLLGSLGSSPMPGNIQNNLFSSDNYASPQFPQPNAYPNSLPSSYLSDPSSLFRRSSEVPRYLPQKLYYGGQSFKGLPL